MWSKNVQMWKSMKEIAEHQNQVTSAKRAMSKGVCPLEDFTFLSTPCFKSSASTSKLPSRASNPRRLGIFMERGVGRSCILIPFDQVAARCTGYTICHLEPQKKHPVPHKWKGDERSQETAETLLAFGAESFSTSALCTP